jgi:tRNA nucleotidyltransferase (CCA-adding enzyme)
LNIDVSPIREEDLICKENTMPLNIYLVGGAVRDRLLGLAVKERDWVVVGATEADMQAEGFKRVGKDFPVFIHPKTKEEYALARTERKMGKGYYGFVCHAAPEVTLEEDLIRRDLTINAIAETLEGDLIDPYNGQQDLNNKILRHISPSFAEDPVRILRLARFACRFAPLGFKIADETIALMQQMVQVGEVDELVPERVWQEMGKALKEADPTQFILVLRACGALERLWPSLNKLWGIPQRPEYHPEIDTGIHTLMTLKQAAKLSDDPVTRFAAICHDLGKGETDPTKWPSHRGHEELGVPIIKAFCQHYRVPKEYKELAVMVSRYHLHCHRVAELKASTLMKTLEKMDVFRNPARFEKFLQACEADAKGRTGLEERAYPQADHMRAALKAAQSVDIQVLVKQGYVGEALGRAIHKARVNTIKAYFKQEN